MPAGTLIATPFGEARIERLAAGMFVLSLDELGAPFAAQLVHVGSTPVRDHTLVRVELTDGRTFAGSAGHPLVDGRTFGALGLGDPVDGSSVIGFSSEPYEGASTWDILPEGPTGAYRADGVIVGSTLRTRR